MVFGTFDFLHKGHIHFFKQARSLAKRSFLIVSVSRSVNTKKIKGAKPFFSEKTRMGFVKKTGLADKVVLGGLASFLPHIVKEKPEVIALGYDQTNYTQGLKQKLLDFGLEVKVKRLLSHKPHVYKSSLLKPKAKKI